MNHFRLIVLFFLSFFCSSAFSLDPVSSSWSSTISGSPSSFSDLSSCKVWSENWAKTKSRYAPNAYVSSWSFINNQYRGYISRIPSGSDGYLVCAPKSAISCPDNSSLNGGYCVCNSGYEENGDSCVPELPDTCKEIESTCSSFKNERIPRFDVYYSGSTPGGACSNPPLGLPRASGDRPPRKTMPFNVSRVAPCERG